MKQVLLGIFAHPDDEAFGPSAFLYRQAHSDTDVHLVLLTDGDAGINNGYQNLAEQRLSEWQESGKRIGVSSQTALHYPDGKLSNSLYLEISNAVLAQIDQILTEYTEETSLTLMTFERNGISGHLDHIAASYITTFVYEKLKEQQPKNVKVDKLMYYCLPDTVLPQANTNWLYMPAGYPDELIDFKHEYSDIADVKRHIMQAHTSQKADMESILSRQDGLSGDILRQHQTDHFIIYR